MTTHTDLIARLRDDEANCHENAGEAADALESLEQQVAALRIDAALGKAIRPNYEEAKTRGVEYIRWTVSDIDAAMGEK